MTPEMNKIFQIRNCTWFITPTEKGLVVFWTVNLPLQNSCTAHLWRPSGLAIHTYTPVTIVDMVHAEASNFEFCKCLNVQSKIAFKGISYAHKE